MGKKEEFMKVKKIILISVVSGMFLYFGLNCSKESKAPSVGSTIQIRGKLIKGTSHLGAQSTVAKIRSLQEPLVNYKLYCVTFEDTPKAASGTADNTGAFSLSIDAAGIPFGCFVIDSSGKHVADLIFAQGLTPGAPTSGSIILTDSADIGTITVDLDKGIAVVDISNVSGQKIDAPFDPTGTWNFTCTSPAADPVYKCMPPEESPESIFLHRISGTLPDNSKIYGLGVWASQQHYNTCGGVEGVGECDLPTKCITATKDGISITLDEPDARFAFTPDTTWQNSSVPNSHNACESTAQTCVGVTNINNSWGYCTDPPTCSNFQPYTDTQCQQICFANGFWDDSVRLNPDYCIQNRSYNWTKPPDDPEFKVLEEGPTSRFAWGELVYSSNDSASFASIEHELKTIWDPVNNREYICNTTRTTIVTFVRISETQLNGNITQNVTLSHDSPPECLDTNIPNNDVANDVNSPLYMLFKLTK